MKRFACMLLLSVMACSVCGQVPKVKKVADAVARAGKVTSAVSSNLPKPMPNPYVHQRNVPKQFVNPSQPTSIAQQPPLHSVNVHQELLKRQQLLYVRPNQNSLCMNKDSIAAANEWYREFLLKMDSIGKASTKTIKMHNDE